MEELEEGLWCFEEARPSFRAVAREGLAGGPAASRGSQLRMRYFDQRASCARIFCEGSEHQTSLQLEARGLTVVIVLVEQTCGH